MNQNNNAPIDKGRLVVVAERYPTKELDNNNQAVMKNRYATVGRATLWPMKENSNMPNVEIEIDTMPLGAIPPLKMYVFWDSESQNYQDNKQTGNQAQQGQSQNQGRHGQQQTSHQNQGQQSSNGYQQRRG